MLLLSQRGLGILILVLLGALVVVKRITTGSVVECKSGDNLWVWLTNSFNLFFLLAVNPLAALLLITGHLESVDVSHFAIHTPRLVKCLETAGLGLYLSGYLLMAWALLRLGGNYQLGGSAPRAADEMVIAGPYRFIRHPMYTAALSISLGLALLVQSMDFFSVFGNYVVLSLVLIPVEEAKLRQAYSDQYIGYQKKVKKLISYLY